jgi:hypothetical protein
MVGMQPALYHRYNVDENDDDDDDDNHDDNDENDHFKNTYGAQMITDAISNIDLNDTSPWHNPQVHEEISHEDDDKPGGLSADMPEWLLDHGGVVAGVSLLQPGYESMSIGLCSQACIPRGCACACSSPADPACAVLPRVVRRRVHVWRAGR